MSMLLDTVSRCFIALHAQGVCLMVVRPEVQYSMSWEFGNMHIFVWVIHRP
ncbi:hypothetical protein PISMIDRAFT_544175 [Pisolithus microcarpus 441]|uniref:Uncharacterized protein n=1 Tax=Pisolithus microcarpus 441 TaxID=765257 RepID=A0A0C9ZG18_9AGAM|nr:hypothetical protein PISMIDRAFT_544175 [Pisolithus microcarpus 441]